MTLDVDSSIYIHSNGSGAESEVYELMETQFSHLHLTCRNLCRSILDRMKGSLIVNGATLSSQDSDQRWNGVTVYNSAEDTNTNFLECVIENASNGITCIASRPSMINSNFINNIYGINADINSSPYLMNNHFQSNHYPVKYYSKNIDSTIVGNTFETNQEFR